ncbi:MAG: PAS domain S-box protein, partial [Deltaproteobacteria bacterium]|nr:PAS domain S-box protein [Deltaproteobacteria bacterium]
SEEKARKLSLAVEQSPTTVIITDLNGDIEYVNPKFVETTGYSVEEAIGRNPHILKTGDMPSEVYTKIWETIKSGRVWRGEFHNKKKNGESYWEQTSISPIGDSSGQISNFIVLK